MPDLSLAPKTKFLVTGGAGFIGSNLTEFLLNNGYFVRVLDNFSTSERKNIDAFLGDSSFELIEGDICDFPTCLKSCKDIDYVLHQAAWGAVQRSVEMPLVYEDINSKGTLNVMTAARDSKVKRFVFASSSSVYGDSQILPQKEGFEGNLLSPYAITKKINELYAQNYYESFGLETVGLRYFNVFGRRQNPNSDYAAVIPKFISMLIKDEQPVIFGDGTTTRDFTYIEDVIQANIKACIAPPTACGKAYNIACGEQTNLNELLSKICELLDKDITPIYAPEKQGDIKHSVANIDNAKQYLGYAPEWNFDRGIAAAMEWYLKARQL